MIATQAPTPTKPIVRSRRCSLDIWDNERETIRIFADRTTHRHPCRVYENANSWGCGETTERYTGQLHQRMLEILQQEIADEEDYTDRLFEIINAY